MQLGAMAATNAPAFAGALRSALVGAPGARVVRVASRCQLHRRRFAALGTRREAVEVAQLGEEGGAGRGEEGLVSTVSAPAPANVVSFQDWYMADKQLMAIKKAAEALEKLADIAREELPGTMAAIRLSGMEISDLTMELNDLGQEISKGVRSSARVLSSAETGMRQAGGIASNGAGTRTSSSNAATGGPHRKTNA